MCKNGCWQTAEGALNFATTNVQFVIVMILNCNKSSLSGFSFYSGK